MKNKRHKDTSPSYIICIYRIVRTCGKYPYDFVVDSTHESDAGSTCSSFIEEENKLTRS